MKLKKLKQLEASLPTYVISYLDEKELNSQISTVLSYAYDLHTFFRYILESNPSCKNMLVKDITLEFLEHLTFEDINEYQKYLSYTDSGEKHMNGERGIARRMAPLRGFFKFACLHGYMKSNPTLGAAKRKKAPKDDIIRMNAAEVGTMLNTVQKTNIASARQRKFCEKAQLRDTALITLFLNTGIRVSECVGLDIDDINFIDKTLYIVRKGGKSSVLYFNDTVAQALNDYMELERAPLLGDHSEEKALFISNRKQRMCVKAVENVVKKFAKESVSGKHITPHKLRSTYGTALYQETGDIRLVADVLGHEDINTTAKNYAAIEEKHRQIAAKVNIYGNE
ncbi:MAG: tyrosine-type recombinase/integrase [Acetatifactor sp.]|nr:tyrosine-type recombinase/integrase [Acetatifactor sp.]